MILEVLSSVFKGAIGYFHDKNFRDFYVIHENHENIQP